MESRQPFTLSRGLALVARVAVGLAFVYAGSIKSLHPAAFIADVWSYRLVPVDTAYWIAAFLPWVEVVVGAALVTGRQLAGARFLAAGMLGGFLIAIIVSWARGLDIACGCFGAAAASGAATNYLWLVVRDVLLMGCLAFDIVVSRRPGRR